MRPRSGDEETEEYEYVPDAITGVASTGGQDELASVLLLLSGEITKLCVLLQECGEDEFKAVQTRLDLFRSLVAQLPVKPRPGRRIGFKAMSKKPRKAKGAK
jgi:hypothetical protein